MDARRLARLEADARALAERLDRVEQWAMRAADLLREPLPK